MHDNKLFNREFNRFLWASILIGLSACLGNVVDAVIVGNLIGEDGVSAINLSTPVVQFMFTVSILLSAGAGMLVGMQLGRKDYASASHFFTLSTAGCLFFGVLVAFFGLLFLDTLTGLLCTNELLLDKTRDYLYPLLLGAPIYMMVWALANMAGVDGSPRLVSIAILIDNAVNLCLDVVLIHWLDLGIEGSSMATVIGHIVGIVIICRHFLYPNRHLRIYCRGGEIWTTLKQTVSQGTPLALASICLTTLFLFANNIVLSSLGRAGIFAFSICMNILYIYNLFIAGACRTIQSLGSIQVGKRDDEKFRMVISKSFRFITIAMFITCVIILTFPEAIAEFFGAVEQDLIDEGKHALRVFAFSFIPFCYIYTLMIVYKLYGYHWMALFISLVLSLMVIPILWIMSRFAPDYLWYSYIIAYAIDALLILIFHRLKNMKFELKPQ